MPSDDGSRVKSGARNAIVAVLLLLTVGHVLVTRLSWADIPMQTDAGMWAYIGGRILDGARPYRDLWESKPPGIYYTFAAVQWLFGRGGDAAFRWLDAALTAAICGMTWLAARRFASRTAAAAGVFLLGIVLCHRVLADWGCNVEKFVALLEIAACWLALRAWTVSRSRWTWFAAGACCGLAGAFKQTGALFLLAATVALLSGRRRTDHNPSGVVRAALLWLGAGAVWISLAAWMSSAGLLGGFWRQAVVFDLSRLGPGMAEGARLEESGHWLLVWSQVRAAGVLFGPAAVGAVAWLLSRRSPTGAAVEQATRAAPLILAYAGLTFVVFPLAPHGYGHYLLQATPPAALMCAWLTDRMLDRRLTTTWTVAAAAAVVLGIAALGDHARFTFDPSCEPRRAYALQRREMNKLIETLRNRTSPGESVMLWPPDYAASYYARRVTPLEASNADVIFKGRLHRLSPPMPEILDRLARNPPDVIVDTTPIAVEGTAGEPARPPELLVPAGGFSLYEPPDDEHPYAEGRALAPLKRWVRANYGGQERVAGAVIYRRGEPWRPWQEIGLR